MTAKNILLIDNYDSFTYNLVHYFAELGAHVRVVRNDAITVERIAQEKPAGIVLSPGPGTPDDSGICLEVIRQLSGVIPLFGVCLGHQAMGQVFGGKVVRAPQLMHGKTSPVFHESTDIFSGLPSPFTATRYHSLIVEHESLPACLRITAHTEDGIIMGLAHEAHPTFGVQFHPESIASEHGHDLLKNFLNML
jgi:anthranilate synthase component II